MTRELLIRAMHMTKHKCETCKLDQNATLIQQGPAGERRHWFGPWLCYTRTCRFSVPPMHVCMA